MFILTRKYPRPQRYDLFLTCHTHGWTYLAPFLWDEKHNSLDFPLLIKSLAVDITVQQDKRSVSALICSEKKLNSATIKRIDSALIRILGLKEDTAELFETARKIGGPYPELMKKGAGRLLRGASLWEDAAKTLFTTNCSWNLTQKMCEKICSSNYTYPAPSGRYPFPSPVVIAADNAEMLRRRIPVGYRADYLRLLALIFSKDPGLGGLENNQFSYEDAYKIARSLMGFGSYAAVHLLILAGYYEQIPVDSEVSGYIKKNYRIRNVTSFITRHYSSWGRYKWWGLKMEKMLRRQNWLGE